MTAEICVMNTMGVAMAADSAVTIGSGRKIYNSANKLFSLSKFHPVAIMIYGNAEFLRVPWETIIKVYRQKLDDQNFASVENFANDFINFMKTNDFPELNSAIEEEKFIYSYINEIVNEAFRTILEGLKEKVNQNPDVDVEENELKEIANTYIDQMLHNIDQEHYINGFDDEDFRKIMDKHGEKIEQVIMETFENMIFSENLVTNLGYIVANSIIKSFSKSKSGIVIAGFGERELYPSLYAYDIDGIVNGKLKYVLKNSKIVGKDLTAAIVPFAQDDMVHTFIRGVNPEIENITDEYMQQIFNSLPGVIVEQLKDNLIKTININELKAEIENGLIKIHDEFNKIIGDFKRENFTIPILSIVDSLPKDELAEMAESLVNLTSFKRRVSSSLETVGGPVDVAVITKGDGLVWIKRKHYFKQELNQQFHQNYFRRDKNESTTP